MHEHATSMQPVGVFVHLSTCRSALVVLRTEIFNLSSSCSFLTLFHRCWNYPPYFAMWKWSIFCECARLPIYKLLKMSTYFNLKCNIANFQPALHCYKVGINVNEQCLLLDREIYIYLSAKVHFASSGRLLTAPRLSWKRQIILPHFCISVHGQSDRQRVVNKTFTKWYRTLSTL